MTNTTLSCIRVMDAVSSTSAKWLSMNNVNIGNSILEIASRFLVRNVSTSSSDRVIKSIRNSVYVIQKAVISAMLPGAASVTLTSDNIRISTYHSSIKSLDSAILSPPPSTLESQFSALLPKISLSEKVRYFRIFSPLQFLKPFSSLSSFNNKLIFRVCVDVSRHLDIFRTHWPIGLARIRQASLMVSTALS